ncbi:MAG: hypothetical protein IID33_00765 [Planctomycetes bacterium]|nr:hypothetical protein [Planctomycetota bacterium]
MLSQRCFITLVLAAVLAPPLTADEPLDLVPAESLLCWSARPTESETPPSAQSAATLATWVNMGSRLVGHPLEGEVLIWLRLAEAMGQMTRYPHAIALIDARARRVGRDGRRVDRLKVVLVVKTGGDSSPFRRTIQKIVNEQTDADSARLRRAKIGDWLFQTLRDSRLPKWAEISWGDMGEFFVVTLGEDVWADVADVALGKAPALGRDEWLRGVRGKRRLKPTIEAFEDFKAIRERLDPLVDGRASEFLSAWNASTIDRCHWAVGFENRGLFCITSFVRGGRKAERILAHPSFGNAALREAIPSEVNYAIFRVSPRRMIPMLVESLIATRNQKTRDNLHKQWELIQQHREFDAQRDLLDNLGDHIVLHNYPPHPLNIPLTVTILFEIRKEPQLVRETIDKMCRGWKAGLEQTAERTGVPNLLSLRHDDDGVWYLQIGFIAGPAWTVTDRFVITSWSPAALRDYLNHAGAAAGNRTAK